ncbi:MAG: L,D-transpeptidase [Gammaproteobacteria bacterium]|nr:L,D-transpeptidase [Gammaproteobacteria bacterium]
MKKTLSVLVKMSLFLSASSLAIPLDAAQSKHPKHHKSSVSASIPAEGRKVFIFNPRSLNWSIYGANGKLVRSGKAVGGKGYCPDVKRACRTPVGAYAIYHKEGPHFISSKYPLPRGGASMPWAMFFYKGFAIHGSNEMPGHHASHGCIRVYPNDARWMSGTLPVGTKVVVKSY